LDSDPESLTSAELGEVASDIAAVILQIEPDVVVSYGADGGYGHPDHIRAHQAARTAAEVLHVPFYAIETGKRADLTVDVTPVIDRKRAALAAHRTQLTLGADTFSLSSGDPRPIGTPERFSRLRPPGNSFRDHTLVSRILACVLSLVLGAFVGATLTVTHQATLGGFPWGVVVACILTAALLLGLRLVFETRVVPGFAAIGLLGISALLAAQSAGGSVLVPGNVAGYTWTFAPVLIALLVLAWPRITRPAGHKIETVPAAKGPDLP
jgi:N-acetyl-1-D-myo-inositol-2-amino-2-deoxy-alpha-D-glucopyranoside deacetylase